MKYYDIYGFVLAVEEGLEEAFEREFWRFGVDSASKADLILKRAKGNFATKMRGSSLGLKIPFAEDDNLVLVNPEVPSDYALFYVEPLITWKNKCRLHASAVSKDGQAFLFPALGGVGKTQTALFLLRQGFEYLSDDWLIVGEDKAFAYPKTLHIFDYNLRDKEIARKVLGKKIISYTILQGLLNFGGTIFNSRLMRIVFNRLMPHFTVDLNKLFPYAKIGAPTKIANIFYLERGEKFEISKLDSNFLAEKMVFIFMHEFNHFFYEYYNWVALNKKSEKIERLCAHQLKILKDTFKHAQCYKVKVPGKFDSEDLYKLLKVKNLII